MGKGPKAGFSQKHLWVFLTGTLLRVLGVSGVGVSRVGVYAVGVLGGCVCGGCVRGGCYLLL